MREPLLIQSRNNPRIKSTVALKESKNRRESERFLLEGLHEIKTAIQYGFPIKEIYCVQSVYDSEFVFLKDSLSEVNLYLINKSVSEKISLRQNPAGILAVCEQGSIEGVSAIKCYNAPILILESIEKPGNLGAILRSAKAFGFSDVILNNSSIDFYHPNVIRNSRGHSMGVRVYRDTIENTVEWLKLHSYTSYVASPDSELDIAEMSFSSKTAIVLGNEHDGVSDEWKSVANKKLRISMNETVDSLNVSVSASIVLYELFKELKSSR